MTVDPKEDVDICVTCLTKKAPQLPLREELPSLGVELIYRAKGVGAKTSKHAARRAAKAYRYIESFKDLQKRRFFPKSSHRIKSILDERKRQEAEIRDKSSAVSYESYQNELYGGDWVTDESSSSSSGSMSKSAGSSQVSAGSDIQTTGNRKMTKTALKRWRLFRIKSKKKKTKGKKDKEKKKRENAKTQERSKGSSGTSVGSLIGEEVFMDFHASVQGAEVNGAVESTASDYSSSVDDIFPSWYPEKLKQRLRNNQPEQPSWYPSSPPHRPAAVTQEDQLAAESSPLSGLYSYYEEEEFLPSVVDDELDEKPAISKSPSSYGRPAPSFLDSDHYEEYPEARSPDEKGKYPNASSPTSDFTFSKMSKKYQVNRTPTTQATSHQLESSSESESSPSVVSSITGSYKRRGYIIAKVDDDPHEPKTVKVPQTLNSPTQEKIGGSVSESSLIGLNVAFPTDREDVPTLQTAGATIDHAVLPQPHSDNDENDVDVSGMKDTAIDVIAGTEQRKEEPKTVEDQSKEDQSGIFDTVLSFFTQGVAPSDTKQAEVAITTEQQPTKETTNPFDDDEPENVEMEGKNKSSPFNFFNEIPDQLYKAFGKEENPATKVATETSATHEACASVSEASKIEEVASLTLVASSKVDMDEIISNHHPIVPGVDVDEEPVIEGITEPSPSDEKFSDENTSNAFAWDNESYASVRSAENKEDVKKKNKSLKWWKGSFPKFRSFLKKKKVTTLPITMENSSGATTQNNSSEILSQRSSMTDKVALRRQTVSIQRYDHAQRRSPVIKVSVSNDDGIHPVLKPEIKSHHVPVVDESTANAFASIPDAFYVSLEKETVQKADQALQKPVEDKTSFHHTVRATQMRLTQYETDVVEIARAVNEDLTIAFLKDPDDGQMLLHRFSSSPFPSHVESDDFLGLLLEDISIFKDKLELIYVLFPAASEAVDSDGDLPVHLLARNLMEWETSWYAKMYNQASKETINGSSGGPATRAITTLYHSMSLCVEILLKRVVQREDLCRQRGSMGALLPLHIATIFTCPIYILRQALESYPDGALESASIKGYQSFVPDGALPLEIHETFCTDFPKWEVEVASSNGMKWSKSRAEENTIGSEDTFRRSDLLFAYNTTISKFWKNKDRIRRIESRINHEAKLSTGSSDNFLGNALQRLWIWFCTFTESKGSPAVFSRSVERVISDLPMNIIRILAAIPTPSGQAVLDVAHKDCVAVIRKRLDSLVATVTPSSPGGSSRKSSRSKILNSWDELQMLKSSSSEEVNIGQVCRAVFNISERDIPTSFVILPYRLDLNEDGTLSMSSKESAAVAIKFADCLLKLTDPRSVLYFMEKKSEAYFGVSMYEGAGDEAARQNAFSRIEEFEGKLIELYRRRHAYLYLIDEATGVPIVSQKNDVYPLVLNQPENIVRKLLPMMVAGMIQMRGSKAVSVISTVLLDESISIVPAHYESAAKMLKSFLENVPDASDYHVKNSVYLQSQLDRFVRSSRLKQSRNMKTFTSTSEWKVELSILRMLFDYNDPRRNYAGLRRRKEGSSLQWILQDRDVVRGTIYDDDASSRSSLEFYQPNDDGSVASKHSQRTSRLDRVSATDVGLSSALSDETTESQLIATRSRILSKDFAIKVPICSTVKDSPVHPVWNPAEQIWVDVRNRLEVTGCFWDEAQVTNLRVSVLQQANRISVLQKRIRSIQQAGSVHTRRAQELYCRIMGEDINVLDVPSLRNIFGARQLLSRLNELENRILENEVDCQHFGFGVKILRQELLTLRPPSEDEDDSTSSNEWSDSSDSLSSISKPKLDQSPTDPIIETATALRSSSSRGSANAQSWNSDDFLDASRNAERIRRAFDIARRRTTIRSSHESGSINESSSAPLLGNTTSSTDQDVSKVSSLTTRSSTLRQQAAAARSRAINAALPSEYPSEIALPALNHMELKEDASEHLPKGASGHSSSSASFENTSVVQFDKETGLIEF